MAFSRSRFCSNSRWQFFTLDPIKNFQDSPIKLIVGTTADEYRLWSEFEPYYKNLSENDFYKRLNKIFQIEAVNTIATIIYPRTLLRMNLRMHCLIL